jgi:hypothetical protein
MHGAGLHGKRCSAQQANGDRRQEQLQSRARARDQAGPDARRRSTSVLLGPRNSTSTQRTGKNREEALTTKSKKNLTKSKRFVLKLRTCQIHLDTNLFPKIHCLGLTQTLGKTDRRNNENGEKI